MAYCGPAGVPYIEFLGGPPGWDDLSRDAALAWQQDRDDACGACGQHRDDWVTIDEQGREREIRPAPYVVAEFHCPSCEALERARKALEDSKRPGVHLSFQRRQPAAPDGLWLPGDP